VSRVLSARGADANATEPAQVGSGRRRLREVTGTSGSPRADAIQIGFSFPVGAEEGLGWPSWSRAGGAGGERAPGGLRAQQVLEPAGCPCEPAAVDARIGRRGCRPCSVRAQGS
jgi:hypothetical protein